MRGWHKLELWIFKRTDQDLGGILLWSSNVEKDDENHHELLRYSKMKNRKVESTMKRIWKILEKDIWLMITHYTSIFEMNLGIAPGKLEESGKILGKDLWVRAHSKENTVDRFWREIAPVELNGLNEITTSKHLERIENGNTSLVRYLQHSRTNE